ncbi:MAG TPA: alpha/beta fold hydrolase [Gemmatimonadales bacterium]|nr:alpha/beta fold hydrolase [Gemmatimonadales bacterium]
MSRRSSLNSIPRMLALCLLYFTNTGNLSAQDTASSTVDHATHHEFNLGTFSIGGTDVPNVKVVYGTYGHLNSKKDNAILLPSHYMADHHGYEWLIGPRLALDTTRYFLIATELFDNGHSSSPSNTPMPFDGPRFPVATIRDNVEAVHRLLLEDVGVTHLMAIIGFSMGAEQAFQWAVSYPDFADCIVATAGTARAWPHGIVRLEAEIGAITQDSGFHDGDYAEQPANGINQFALVWAGWLFSQEWWRKELWKDGAPPTWTMDSVVAWLEKDFSAGADANNLILQARTWMAHDVGKTPGFDGKTEKALRSITVPVLYMPSETDLYFPVGDARYEAGFIPRVTLTPIPSLWGHTAGAAASPADKKFLNQKIAAFLKANTNR